jgi:hypothetical protein
MYRDINPKHVSTIPFKKSIKTAIIAEADAFNLNGSLKIICSIIIKTPKKPERVVIKIPR